MTVMAGLGVWFVDRKLFKQAAFGAEDVGESFLLKRSVSLHHALVTVTAEHVKGLTGRRTKKYQS